MANKLILPSYEIDISNCRHWKYIIIHHSATTDGKTYDWGAIWHYHKIIKGWDTIGYNFGIELLNGNPIFNIGRPLTMTGAHTIGMNGTAIGFLFTGNYDIEPPSEEILKFSVPFLKAIMYAFQIPLENIRGHRDFARKSCPGLKFSIDHLKELIEEVKFTPPNYDKVYREGMEILEKDARGY